MRQAIGMIGSALWTTVEAVSASYAITGYQALTAENAMQCVAYAMNATGAESALAYAGSWIPDTAAVTDWISSNAGAISSIVSDYTTPGFNTALALTQGALESAPSYLSDNVSPEAALTGFTAAAIMFLAVSGYGVHRYRQPLAIKNTNDEPEVEALEDDDDESEAEEQRSAQVRAKWNSAISKVIENNRALAEAAQREEEEARQAEAALMAKEVADAARPAAEARVSLASSTASSTATVVSDLGEFETLMKLFFKYDAGNDTFDASKMSYSNESGSASTEREPTLSADQSTPEPTTPDNTPFQASYNNKHTVKVTGNTMTLTGYKDDEEKLAAIFNLFKAYLKANPTAQNIKWSIKYPPVTNEELAKLRTKHFKELSQEDRARIIINGQADPAASVTLDDPGTPEATPSSTTAQIEKFTNLFSINHGGNYTEFTDLAQKIIEDSSISGLVNAVKAAASNPTTNIDNACINLRILYVQRSKGTDQSGAATDDETKGKAFFDKLLENPRESNTVAKLILAHDGYDDYYSTVATKAPVAFIEYLQEACTETTPSSESESSPTSDTVTIPNHLKDAAKENFSLLLKAVEKEKPAVAEALWNELEDRQKTSTNLGALHQAVQEKFNKANTSGTTDNPWATLLIMCATHGDNPIIKTAAEDSVSRVGWISKRDVINPDTLNQLKLIIDNNEAESPKLIKEIAASNEVLRSTLLTYAIDTSKPNFVNSILTIDDCEPTLEDLNQAIAKTDPAIEASKEILEAVFKKLPDTEKTALPEATIEALAANASFRTALTRAAPAPINVDDDLKAKLTLAMLKQGHLEQARAFTKDTPNIYLEQIKTLIKTAEIEDNHAIAERAIFDPTHGFLSPLLTIEDEDEDEDEEVVAEEGVEDDEEALEEEDEDDEEQEEVAVEANSIPAGCYEVLEYASERLTKGTPTLVEADLASLLDDVTATTIKLNGGSSINIPKQAITNLTTKITALVADDAGSPHKKDYETGQLLTLLSKLSTLAANQADGPQKEGLNKAIKNLAEQEQRRTRAVNRIVGLSTQEKLKDIMKYAPAFRMLAAYVAKTSTDDGRVDVAVRSAHTFNAEANYSKEVNYRTGKARVPEVSDKHLRALSVLTKTLNDVERGQYRGRLEAYNPDNQGKTRFLGHMAPTRASQDLTLDNLPTIAAH